MLIERLEECIDLAETCNYTRTASRFFITQSVLSKHIMAVEAEVGAQLFERDQHGTRLTEAGRLFVEQSRRTVASHKRALDRLDRFNRKADSSFSVGYLLGVAGPPIVTRANKRLAKRYPLAEASYKAYEFNDLDEKFNNEEIDLAVTAAAGRTSDESAYARVLFRDRLYLAMSNQHPLAQSELVRQADLDGLRVHVPSSATDKTVNDYITRLFKTLDANVVYSDQVLDLSSISILLSDTNNIVLTFGHVSRLLSDRTVFRPLEGCNYNDLFVAVWKKTHNSAPIAFLADSFKELVNAELAKTPLGEAAFRI